METFKTFHLLYEKIVKITGHDKYKLKDYMDFLTKLYNAKLSLTRVKVHMDAKFRHLTDEDIDNLIIYWIKFYNPLDKVMFE